jgi:hypothetical protein
MARRLPEADLRILNLDEFFRRSRRVDSTGMRGSGGIPEEEQAMANETNAVEEERIPVMQQVLDNPFLLLFLGIAVPTVFYIVWGIMEIVTIPVAK